MTRIEKICAWLCDKIGSPQVLIGSIIAQVIWAVVGQTTHWDAYPFPFLLTCSNILQLVLIFAVACGQRESLKRSERRAEQDHKIIKHLETILDNQRA
jgi:uncharacterized membrane protein